MSQYLNDAVGTLNFVRSQTHVLSTRAFNQEYDLVDYQSLVPVNTDYPEWASGADFQLGDMSGAAKWQSGWAKDVPLADVSLLSVGVDFAMYAVGYKYNVEEIGKAQFAGFPLTARKAIAARQAADIFCAEAALYGAGHPGWTGLINKTGATVTPSPANGTGNARNWVDANGVGLKTPEQVITELNGIVMGPLNLRGVLSSQLADTVLLSPAAYQYLVNTPYGVTAPNMNVLQYFMANNPYTTRNGRPITIRDLPALADAATDAAVTGQGRAVAYRNTMDALEFPMPMVYRFLDVKDDGPLGWQIPGIGRVGQLTEVRSGSIRYLDGISPAPPAL